MAVRSSAQRKADVLAKLAGDDDAWVATASPAGRPHLVPLSLAWDDDTVIVTVEATSVTARNVASTGVARVALGALRDVVMIDTDAELVEASQLDDERADLFARRMAGTRARCPRTGCTSSSDRRASRRGARSTRSRAEP